MTRRRAADDRPGASTPCCALTDRGVARSQNARTQNNARHNYENFLFHDADPICGIKPQTAADIAGVIPSELCQRRRCYYGLTNTFFARMSSTSPPCAIFAQSYL